MTKLLSSEARLRRSGALGEIASLVSLGGVTKSFGSGADRVVALDGVDLEVGVGEFVCVVGASGCGKSTLLNLIAGLDQPSMGSVECRAAPALMFQEAALFPWLTVGDNVALPLRIGGMTRTERQTRAADLLALVHLEGQSNRRPHELSGGMRQRVALARALAQNTELLLMDEPFGALDAMTRDLLHDELERIWGARRLSVVFVTHNVRESARLADRIVLLTSRPGRIAEAFPVDIPRPRRIDSPEVSSLAAHITDRLRQEVRRHGGS